MVFPAVATPRSRLKRPHTEIIDLTTSEEDSSSLQVAGSTGSDERPVQKLKVGDDESESVSNDDSVLDDYVDHLELNPYVAGKSIGNMYVPTLLLTMS